MAAQGQKLRKHLRKLGIPPGNVIVLAPAESRDFYLTRRLNMTEGHFYYSIEAEDPGKTNNPEGQIQWACAGCGSTMKSRKNMEDRLLVIFSIPSKDPECEGDPYCVQMGSFNSEIEAKVAFLKECELRDRLVVMSDGQGEEWEVTPELMLECIQNLNNQSLAQMLNVGRTIVLKSCDYTRFQSGADNWRHEQWIHREIYCESTKLSMAKENTPFACMVYDKAKMRIAEHAELNAYLTFMCCFMDEEAGWEKKKARMAPDWKHRSAVAGHIKALMSDAQEMRKTLSRTKLPANL